MGKTCGRRERESRREGRRDPSLRVTPSRVVTVEGIPAVWKAALFAGRCRKHGLGRSVSSRGYPPAGAARRRQRMSGGRRGGERRRACALKSACTGARTRDRRMRTADASFARSFDPCASILTRCGASKALRGEAVDPVSRLGKPTRVGGTSTGAGRDGRCAARRVSPLPRGRGVTRQKRKEVEASVPARTTSPGLVARTSCFSCRSRQATPGLEYARHTRSKKSGQGRVNGGLARSDGRRVKPSAGASSEMNVARRTPPDSWERIGAGPRVARECHPAVTTSPKAVQWSRDRGCNGHRILRRVSWRWKASRVITRCFGHAKRSRVISVLDRILRPVYRGQKPTAR